MLLGCADAPLSNAHGRAGAPLLPSSGLVDARHAAGQHQAAAAHLGPGDLADQPGQDRPVVAGPDAPTGHQLCFAAVIDAGCAHAFVVVGSRKPRQMPQFNWGNTALGDLKTMVHGAHKAFNFGKYASNYLGAFACRFNLRFDLRELLGAPRPLRSRARARSRARLAFMTVQESQSTADAARRPFGGGEGAKDRPPSFDWRFRSGRRCELSRSTMRKPLAPSQPPALSLWNRWNRSRHASSIGTA